MPAPRLHPCARLLIATAGAVVLSVVVAIVVALATAVSASLTGQNAESRIEKFFSENLLLVNLFVYPPILLWLWFCRRFFDRRAFVSLGLRARGFFGQFLGGTFCGFLAVAFLFGVLLMSGNLQFNGVSVAAQVGGWEKSLLILLGWLAMMLCVGFFEEVAFRGYAFHNLNAWLGARWANAIQALVFALIHLGNLGATGKTTSEATLAAGLAMPNIALIGVFFTLCYLKTGSLWFPIAFHAAWNFFLGCVFSLPVSGLPIFQLFDVSVSGSVPLTGGAFGPEASLLLTPILLALIFVVARAPDSLQAATDLQTLHARESAEVDEEAAADPASYAEDEQRANRFRTRMGKRGQELNAETQQTLRLFNESKKRAAENPIGNAIAATPAADPGPEPEPKPQPATVPMEVAVDLDANSTVVAESENPSETEAASAEAPSEMAQPQTATLPPSAPPAPAATKPKPSPRW